MFRVLTTQGEDQAFQRWTDALEAAKALMPQCKGWLQDVRILEGKDVVWVYSRSHKYPMYVGPRTYDRLAQRFIQEAQEAAGLWSYPPPNPAAAAIDQTAAIAEDPIEQGRQAERQAIAQKLLATMEDAAISQVTGLSIEAVQQLRSRST